MSTNAADGMRIRAYDPAAGCNAGKVLSDNSLVEIMDNQYDALNGADALAVVTDWNQFRNPNFNTVRTALMAPVIFDGRNLYSIKQMTSLGFTYFCVGRPPVV